MEKILRIDLTKKTATCEDLPEAYRYLGGRGLSSRIVLDEVPPAAILWGSTTSWYTLAASWLGRLRPAATGYRSARKAP